MALGTRLLISIQGGPLASRRAVIEPGQSLRVGRSERADLVVPRDAQMSAVHFELSWDGQRCFLRDRDSAKGTLVQGERVSAAELGHGAWIRAGETDFRVHVEGATPPVSGSPSPIEEKIVALEALRRCSDLFAIVDASRGPRLRVLLSEAADEQRSLYEGIKGEALAASAPYLVALRPGSLLLERLVREGWGARWATYLRYPRSFNELRRHLRRFLIVQDDDSRKRFYLRFYDPRVLRVLLPACTPRQRQELFGEIACFLVEDPAFHLVRLTPDFIPLG